MGVSGEPTAGLVPGVPVSALPDPDPATSGGACRFGDGLAIGPDLEGAAEVALAQALAPLSGGPPDLLCVFVAAGVPARSGLVEAAARQVMTASGARTTIGATAAGVCGDGRAVDHGRAVAVGAATLPGARLRPFRPDARPEDGLPTLHGDERAAVLLVDPYTFPLAGFRRTPARCRWWAAWPARAVAPDRTGCSSTARCTPTGRSGCSSAETSPSPRR